MRGAVITIGFALVNYSIQELIAGVGFQATSGRIIVVIQNVFSLEFAVWLAELSAQSSFRTAACSFRTVIIIDICQEV